MATSDAGAPSAAGRIAVFVRVRPHERATPGLVFVSKDHKSISFTAQQRHPSLQQRGPDDPPSQSAGPEGGPKFTFAQVFGPADTQETVFDRAAVPAVLSALDGYNATVFAYGQTGSGKCLSPDTRVLTASGTCVTAREVRVGDALVGDEGRARVVLSEVRGRDAMYRVREAGEGVEEGFECNGRHLVVMSDGGRGRTRTRRVSEVFREAGGAPGCPGGPLRLGKSLRGIRRRVRRFPAEFDLRSEAGKRGVRVEDEVGLAREIGETLVSGDGGWRVDEVCRAFGWSTDRASAVPAELLGATWGVRDALLGGILSNSEGHKMFGQSFARSVLSLARSLGRRSALLREGTRWGVRVGDESLKVEEYEMEVSCYESEGDYCGFHLAMISDRADETAVLRYLQSAGESRRSAVACLLACGVLIPSTSRDPPSGRVPGRFLLGDYSVTHNTWTITGGTKKFSTRGVIPRALSMVFAETRSRSHSNWAVHISYMEIYNEQAYDLLDPTHEGDTLEELPKVSLRTGEDGELYFVNLRRHHVLTEEQALNLLFLGDTNRTIAETPMNPASSRSHCIFTVFLEATMEGEKKVRRSKLHLVDLAGSERASKTGSRGDRFREATYINKGLHFLEQVIVMLQQKKTHIPYRNSKITYVLRDSLGGNCRTAMISTITPTADALYESLDTCKFSSRVACVSNRAVINEHLDPKLEVALLRKEVDMLKLQLQQRALSGAGPDGVDHPVPVTDSPPPSKEMLMEQIAAYVEDNSPEAFLGVHDARAVTECFAVFKAMISKLRDSAKAPATEEAQKMIKELRARVAQRDREVSVLVASLSSYRSAAASATGGGSSLYSATLGGVTPFLTPPPSHIPSGRTSPSSMSQVSGGTGVSERATPGPNRSPLASLLTEPGKAVPTEERAWKEFRSRHADREAFEENTHMLRKLKEEAKLTAEVAAQAREKAILTKATLEKERIKKALRTAVTADGGAEEPAAKDPDEERLLAELEHHKEEYKSHLNRLNEVRRKAQTIETLTRRILATMKADFDTWYHVMYNRSAVSPSPSPSAPKPAWVDDNSSTVSQVSHGRASSVSPRVAALSSSQSGSPGTGSTPGITPTGVDEADKEIRQFYQLRAQMSTTSSTRK